MGADITELIWGIKADLKYLGIDHKCMENR
jgi:hypothetical protein